MSCIFLQDADCWCVRTKVRWWRTKPGARVGRMVEDEAWCVGVGRMMEDGAVGFCGEDGGGRSLMRGCGEDGRGRTEAEALCAGAAKMVEDEAWCVGVGRMVEDGA